MTMYQRRQDSPLVSTDRMARTSQTVTRPRQRTTRWLSLFIAGCTVFACARRERESERAKEPAFETLELRYQGNNGIVSPVELAEDLGYLEPIRLNFVGSTISGPASVQAVVTGDTDFGGAFNGAIIKLVAAQVPIVAVIGYYGVDDRRQSGFYVKVDSPIRSARDLLGKKISMNTLGAHSEFMVKEFLFRSQLEKADTQQVTLVVIPPVNGEQVLRQGQVDVAVLGDIYRDRAIENGGLRSVTSDYELFGEFTAGSYVMMKSFIRENPNTTRKFVEAMSRAIEWARETPRETVIQRLTSIVGKRGRPENAATLRYWRSYGVAGRGGLMTEKDFQIWIDWMIKDGELAPGELAARQIYTNEFNPYAAEDESRAAETDAPSSAIPRTVPATPAPAQPL
jgi:ABC-type nitrate/sulfonate/bicarbonate transport system substrate-binding protein